MLTPEIKTNLILKEIGIKRYLLRPKINNSAINEAYFYKKGKILSFLDKPFKNFVKEQQKLIEAIMASTKLDQGDEESDKISFSSNNELKKEILSFDNVKSIIIFGNIFDEQIFLENSIQAPSINELSINKTRKKELWQKIQSKLNL
tara:strand:- start:3751 stop:4191 length:441 start_codon:yes stop_codon:yes gene_type:complete